MQEFDGLQIEKDVLAGLKGFQRQTVDHVFREMYPPAIPTSNTVPRRG